jgi:hypothetical protein
MKLTSLKRTEYAKDVNALLAEKGLNLKEAREVLRVADNMVTNIYTEPTRIAGRDLKPLSEFVGL